MFEYWERVVFQLPNHTAVCMTGTPLWVGALYQLQEQTVSQEQLACLLLAAGKPFSSDMQVCYS